jgi:hypothetical protein
VVGAVAGAAALAAATSNCAQAYGLPGGFFDGLSPDANVPCGSFYDYYPCPVDSGPIDFEPDSGKADTHEGGAEGGERDARRDVEADAPLDAALDASEDAADVTTSDASSDALETSDAADRGQPDAPSDAPPDAGDGG